MAKSRDAFRTISEVAEALDCPAHVLRFWESKFSQIKPVKRAGGRRYYRPDDIALLAGIKTILHEHGMTIKGAQKLLREKGVKHVAAIGGDPLANIETLVDVTPPAPAPAPAPDPEPSPVDDAPAMEPPRNEPAFVQSETVLAAMPDLRGFARRISASTSKDNRDRIAPLVARLETIRDRMRANP